jgi:acyl dehydratase
MLINTRDVYYFGTKTRAPREDSDSRSHSNKHRHSIGMPILTSDKMYSINYGLDRVRFTNPLRIDHPARARVILNSVKKRTENSYLLKVTHIVEAQGIEKPCMVAECMILIVLI